MGTEKLNTWISLLANVGVIAGIVFLAVEINQNNELLAAQDRFNRLQVATTGQNLILESADVSKILAKVQDNKDFSTLTTDESAVWNSLLDNTFIGWEWTFRELSKEEIPLARWKFNAQRWGWLETWDRLKVQYEFEFVEFIEANVFAELM